MSYLRAIIAAARGQPQGIQPRLASRFENTGTDYAPLVAPLAAGPWPAASMPKAGPVSEPAAHRSARQAPSLPTPLPSARAVTAEPPQPGPRQPDRVADNPAPPPHEFASRSPLPIGMPPDQAGKPSVSHAPAPGESAHAPAASSPEASAAPWLKAATPIPAPTPPATTVSPAPTPAASPRRSLPAAASAPTVRVSIGRIDVRADPAPARSANPPAAPRPTGDSALVRHLAQRGRP